MLWRKLSCGPVGQQSGHGNPDKGVKCVPDQIECGNLVGEELDGKQGCAGRDYGPALQQLEATWKWKVTESRQQSQNGNSGVEVQPGSESDCDQEGEQFSRRNFEDIQHW